MSRYIDADKLYELIRTNDYKLATKNGSIDYGMFTVGIKQAIDEQPTADVAEVVRCKDCKHFDKTKHTEIQNSPFLSVINFITIL